MHASLKSFSRMPGNSKVVVLGDMMELGKFSFESHEEVLNYSIELGLENIVTVGKQFVQASHNIPNIKSYLSIEELKTESLKKEWRNKTVLLKGSRSIKLEGLLELF